MRYILLSLLLIAISSALTIDIVKDYPSSIVGGQTINAQYHFSNNMDGQYLIYVYIPTVMDGEANIHSQNPCIYANESIWECKNDMVNGENNPNVYITLAQNILPANYTISTTFSIDSQYIAPSTSGGYSNSGHGGYIPIIDFVDHTPHNDTRTENNTTNSSVEENQTEEVAPSVIVNGTTNSSIGISVNEIWNHTIDTVIESKDDWWIFAIIILAGGVIFALAMYYLFPKIVEMVKTWI